MLLNRLKALLEITLSLLLNFMMAVSMTSRCFHVMALDYAPNQRCQTFLSMDHHQHRVSLVNYICLIVSVAK